MMSSWCWSCFAYRVSGEVVRVSMVVMLLFVAIVMTMWSPCSCYISASNAICFHPLSLCLEPGLFCVWMVYLCRPSCVLVVEGEHPRA